MAAEKKEIVKGFKRINFFKGFLTTEKDWNEAELYHVEKRRLHKALLRYHDPDNWPLIRKTLKEMHLGHLIGSGQEQLVPLDQPKSAPAHRPARRKNTKEAHAKRLKRNRVLTQHTGLPPRSSR